MTANPTVGAFKAVVSAEFADDMVVPMAAQYALTPFEDPVDNSGTLVRNANANTPIATAALLADGTRLSDSGAAALVQAQRVQVRWRELGTELWSGRNDLATYDAAENLFRANLKGPSLGLVKGRTYTVEVRILPAPTDVRPAGEVLQNTFDLGHRSFTISLR